MQEELGADVREVGALGEQQGGGAAHELVNPGEPLGIPLFVPRDRPVPDSLTTPKSQCTTGGEQAETQYNPIDSCPLVHAPE